MDSTQSDPNLDVQLILLAASQHDIGALRRLLRGSSSNPANVQDPDTGYTPLHSAIATCAPDPNEHNMSPSAQLTSEIDGLEVEDRSEATAEGTDTIRLLLQNGAIWNDLDKNDETPGCLARRLGLDSLYQIMVDAGVRAEMLLSRLDEYERLEDIEDEDGEEGAEILAESTLGLMTPTAPGLRDDLSASMSNSAIVPLADSEAQKGDDYLSSNLTFTDDRILDQEKNGVMMAWETNIMIETVQLLVSNQGLRILNIGHGLGIIDEIFQLKSPSTHHIIEAHPEVLKRMRSKGWHEKNGVVLHEGRWQEVVPKLIEEGIMFDIIYFDTFGEDYKALKIFFDQHVIGILEDSGKWGFFNGLGADRQICYDVYSKVVEIDLLECGFDVDWKILKVPDLDRSNTWAGLKRPYWKLEEYRLPIITFMG